MKTRKENEIAKEKADTARDAMEALDGVRSKMLELACHGELESKDFELINALERQLSELYDRLNTSPAFGIPRSLSEMKFENLF